MESRATATARLRRWRAAQAARRAALQPLIATAAPARKPRSASQRPFWGIDGEGITTPSGSHRYMLMCAGDDLHARELFTGKPLSTEQCLDFILSLPPDVLLVGFSFGYDTTMALLDLDPKRRADLFTEKPRPGMNKNAWRATWQFGQRRSPYTYWHGRYGIEYLPGHYLRVCRIEQHVKHSPDGLLSWVATRVVKGSTRTVWESFGFFQKKFAKALDDFQIGSQAERALIAKNKAERAVFARVTKEIRRYCASECALLARMMESLRTNANVAGIRPRTWNGAGKFAAALHTAYHTMTTENLRTSVRSGVLDHADAAYYGGRFECPKIGQLSGPVFEYDIVSAYPAAMLELPCLEHGTWEYLSPDQIKALHATGAGLFVCDVVYKHEFPRCQGMCGLPHRHGNQALYAKAAGSLCWPSEGRGVYWSTELRSAELLGARYVFGSGWRYVANCTCQPFDWVTALFLERKRLGKSTAGYPLKLAINALCGKLAQRVGNPRWNNPIWAGLITAATRAKLNQAIAANPSAIAMIATDGIYCTADPSTSLNPLGLPLSDDLGGWEMARHERGLFVCQPGLYWGKGTDAKLKTRGMSRGFFADRAIQRRFEKAWTKWGSAGDLSPMSAPTVAVPIRLFIGLRLAQARNAPETAGRWIDDERELSFNWAAKRGAGRWEQGHVTTFPLQGSREWRSAIYDPAADYIMNGALDAAELDEQRDGWQWLSGDNAV